MQKDDEAIKQYRSLNPKPMPFTYLVRLDMRLYQLLERDEDEKELLIDVWLGQQNAVSDPRRLRLTLYGAQVTRSGRVCPGMNLYLEIVSIRDRQWDGVYYAVMDLEDTSELFSCRSVETKIDQFYLDSLT